MDAGILILFFLLVPVVLAGVWFIVVFNRFVRLRQHLRESWADIDVQLKRRYDLIPNLVETVKAYARHERETLEAVVRLRDTARANEGRVSSQAADESSLMRGVKRLFAVAEAYPELKADRHFLALQRELADTEDRIAAARRFYNGNVREMNTLCETFPTNSAAKLFGFRPAEYFELASDTERVVPRVEFEPPG